MEARPSRGPGTAPAKRTGSRGHVEPPLGRWTKEKRQKLEWPTPKDEDPKPRFGRLGPFSSASHRILPIINGCRLRRPTVGGCCYYPLLSAEERGEWQERVPLQFLVAHVKSCFTLTFHLTGDLDSLTVHSHCSPRAYLGSRHLQISMVT